MEGVFLGYKVNSDGLMVCPDKVEAFLSLPSPKCLKDVQRLNRKLASLNKSRNGLPANEKVDSRIAYDGRAIRERRINHLLYFAAGKRGHKCCPDDGEGREENTHLFRQLSTARSEINYTPMEKLVLALMLSNLEVTGRLLKWSFELEEHDIQYRPRTSVKGQILADFIMERPEDNLEDMLMEDEEELPDPWTLFTDGCSCADGSRAGLILINPEGMEFTYALRFRFDATNNKA
ncbi:hypothetical protein Tco_1138673 [Tanacetum coccineum]